MKFLIFTFVVFALTTANGSLLSVFYPYPKTTALGELKTSTNDVENKDQTRQVVNEAAEVMQSPGQANQLFLPFATQLLRNVKQFASNVGIEQLSNPEQSLIDIVLSPPVSAFLTQGQQSQQQGQSDYPTETSPQARLTIAPPPEGERYVIPREKAYEFWMYLQQIANQFLQNTSLTYTAQEVQQRIEPQIQALLFSLYQVPPPPVLTRKIVNMLICGLNALLTRVGQQIINAPTDCPALYRWAAQYLPPLEYFSLSPMETVEDSPQHVSERLFRGQQISSSNSIDSTKRLIPVIHLDSSAKQSANEQIIFNKPQTNNREQITPLRTFTGSTLPQSSNGLNDIFHITQTGPTLSNESILKTTGRSWETFLNDQTLNMKELIPPSSLKNTHLYITDTTVPWTMNSNSVSSVRQDEQSAQAPTLTVDRVNTQIPRQEQALPTQTKQEEQSIDINLQRNQRMNIEQQQPTYAELEGTE